MAQKLRLGELLIQAGKIDEKQLAAALGHQKRWGKKIGECCIYLNFITENELAVFLAKALKVPHLDLGRIDPASITRSILEYIPLAVARKERLVPVAVREVRLKRRLVIATSDPTNYKILDELQFKIGLPVLTMVSPDSDIEWFIRRFYMGDSDALARNYVSSVQQKNKDMSGEFILDNLSSIFTDADFTKANTAPGIPLDKDKKKT